MKFEQSRISESLIQCEIYHRCCQEATEFIRAQNNVLSEFKQERFVMKLNIWKEGQDDIQEKLLEYPSLQKYYDMVAKELGCKVEEITCLDVHPDNERSDEEGWQVESFFPRGIDPQTEIIDDDYHTSDFSIGSVIRLKQDGVVFVAETNASPWIVYANPNNIEAWSK